MKHVAVLVWLVLPLTAVLVCATTARSEPVGGGIVTGQFLNPNPTCPPATCTGIGTSQVYWGIADPDKFPSSLAFSGRGFSVPLGQTFVMADLQFQNGTTQGGNRTQRGRSEGADHVR